MKLTSRVLASMKTAMRLRRWIGIFALPAILLVVPLTAAAQITTATITGTIADPGGAQVPAASVTARNVDTGLKRTVVSGDDGSYRIEFLPVGNYVVEAT